MFWQKLASHPEKVVQVPEAVDDIEYDSSINAWIGTKSFSVTTAKKNNQDSSEEKTLSTIATGTAKLSEQQKGQKEAAYARFLSREGCIVDFSGLTVKALKEEPILTSIFIGSESLVFDMHDNNVSNKMVFFVKTDSEDSTKNQTSAQFKSDYPCKYTFVYDASRGCLSMYQNNVKSMSLNVTVPGQFGITPTIPNTILTLNPFRAFFPNNSQAATAKPVIIELGEGMPTDAEAVKVALKERLETGNGVVFSLTNMSSDLKYAAGYLTKYLPDLVNKVTDKNTYYWGASSVEEIKAKLGGKEELIKYVESNASIFERGLGQAKIVEKAKEGIEGTDPSINNELSDTHRSLNFVESSDSLLVSNETSLKMLKRKEGKFSLPSTVFNKLVTSIEQITSVELSSSDSHLLFQAFRADGLNFDFANEKLRLNSSKILSSMAEQLKAGYQTIVITGQFSDLQQTVHTMAFTLIAHLGLNTKIIGSETKGVSLQANIKNEDLGKEEEENHIAMNSLFGENSNTEGGLETQEDKKKEVVTSEDNKTYLYYGTRILLDLLEQLRAKALSSLVVHPPLGLSYSTQFRLASYVLSRPNGRDIIELAKNGIYNNYNGLNSLTHFLYEDRPLSGFDSGDSLTSSVHEIIVANSVDTNSSSSLLNIPLSSYSNSAPAITFESKIHSICQSNSAGAKVLVILENSEVAIFDTQTLLVQLYKGNLKNDEEHKKVTKGAIVDKKNATLFVPTGNFTEKVFEAIVEHKKQVPLDNPDKIEPDPIKLEQLYQMGFSINLCKKVLIKTKNQSLDMAVECLISIQEGGEGAEDDLQVLQEAISLIKPEWVCECCNFNNIISENEKKDVCEVCKEVASLSAYYTKEEIDALNVSQAEAIQHEMDIQAAILASRNETQKPNIAEEGNDILGPIVDVKFGSLEKNYLSRLLIVAGFKSSKASSIVRIRRIGYSCEFLRKLTQEEVDGGLNLTTIKIGNEVLLDTDSAKIEKAQGEFFSKSANTQVDSLIPIFCFEGTPMNCIDQIDLNVEGTILGIQIADGSIVRKFDNPEQDKSPIEKEIKTIYILVGSENSVKLRKYELRCRMYDYFEPSTEMSIVSEISLEETTNKVSSLAGITSEGVLVLHANNLIILSTATLEKVRTVHLGEGQISKVKNLPNGMFVYSKDNNTITQVDIREIEASKTKTIESSQVLSCQDILDYIHQKKQVRFSIETSSGCPLIHTDDPESGSTFEALTLVSSDSQSIKLKLKPKEGSIKNGIMSLSFDFTPKTHLPKANTTTSQDSLISKGGAISINVLDKSEEENYIPLNVVYQSFSDLNSNTMFGQALFGNSAFYTGVTRKGELNYIFLDSQYELDLTVKCLTLISKPKDNSDTVESALIFTTNHTGCVSKFDIRNLGKVKQYKEWISKKSSSLEKWEEYEPVGFADIQATKAVTSLDFVRKAKYICLVFKLTDGKKNTFTLSFVGAQGSTSQSSAGSITEYQRSSEEQIETGVEVRISEGQTQLASKKIFLERRDNKVNFTSISNANIYEEFRELSLEISIPDKPAVNLESISFKLIKCGSGSDRSLKEIFENRDKLVALIKLQAAKISDPAVLFEEKRRILSMLNDIVAKFDTKLIPEIQESIDVDYLITQLVLKNKDREILAEVSSLFERFNQLEGFTKRVHLALSNSIQNISQTETNFDSLKNFFKLVESSMMNPNFASLNKDLKAIVLEAISNLPKTATQESRLLKYLGIENALLDKSVFWNFGSSKKTATKSDEFQDYMPVEYLSMRSATQIDLYCDLKAQVNLDRLLIKFTNMTKFSAETFAFISLYKVDLVDGSWTYSKSNLLFSRPVDQSFVFYTVKTARQPGLNFYSSGESYNCIGYRLANLTGRYFKIRLTFDSGKQTKNLYKMGNHSITPQFYGTVDSSKEKVEAILPSIGLCANAILSKGEVEVKKMSLKDQVQNSSPSGSELQKDIQVAVGSAILSITPTEGSAIATETTGSSDGEMIVDEPRSAEKTERPSSTIENVELLLRECLANINTKNESTDEKAHIIELCESLSNLREERQAEGPENSIGKNSLNFWIAIIDFAGSNKELLKCDLGLNLDHFKSLFENVLVLEHNSKIQDIAIKLMMKSLEQEKAEAAFSLLKKVVSYFSSPENLLIGKRTRLLPIIQKLFQSNKGLDPLDLIDYTLSKVCKKFEQNKELCICQISLVFELLMLFCADDKTKLINASRVPNAVNNILKIILWIYEQTEIPLQAKNILTDKAVKLLQVIFKKNQAELEKDYVADLLVIEMLLIRSLHLNTFTGLKTILKSIFSLSQPPSAPYNLTKSMLTVYSNVLNQLVGSLKGDGNSSKLAAIIGTSKLTQGSVYEFLSYLINSCDLLNKQYSASKPIEEKKEEEANKGQSRKREKLTAEEVAVQRSLSVNSQTLDKVEDEFISTSTIKDLLSIYSSQFKSNSSNPVLFNEISKLILSKNSTKELVKNIFDLYSGHELSEKTLITNELIHIITETVDSLKSKKTAEEDNPALRVFCSNLLESLVDSIIVTGLEKLDSESTKLIISVQELIMGPESKKGLAAVIKTLITSLSKTCVTNILFLSAKELDRVCNYGGPDGFDSLEKNLISSLDIVMNFLIIVTVATSSIKTAILTDMVTNLKSVNLTQVSDCIYQLLNWSVFNNLPTQKKSPSIDRLTRICTAVDHIFKALSENPEAGKIIIRKMFDIVKEVHSILIPKINSSEIGFVGLNFVYNLFTILEKTMEMTLTDAHMINYFAVECSGIQYIFDLLTMTYEVPQETIETNPDSAASLLNLLQKLNYDENSTMGEGAKIANVPMGLVITPQKPIEQKMVQLLSTPKPQSLTPGMSYVNYIHSPPLTPAQNLPVNTQPGLITAAATGSVVANPVQKDFKNNLPWLNPDKYSEEFAKDLICQNKINGKDEKTTDWQKNKKNGGKQIFLYSMVNEFTKNSQELICDFMMTGPVDLRTIKAGFLFQFNDYGNKIIAEPAYIHVHYKRTESDPWKFLCNLDKYEDNGYYQSTTACYQTNFMRTKGSDSAKRIDSVCIPKKIQYLRFLFGKPQISFQRELLYAQSQRL